MHFEALVSPAPGASSSSSSGVAPAGIAGLDEYKQKDFFKVMDMLLLSGDVMNEKPSLREAEELVKIVLEMCDRPGRGLQPCQVQGQSAAAGTQRGHGGGSTDRLGPVACVGEATLPQAAGPRAAEVADRVSALHRMVLAPEPVQLQEGPGGRGS